MPKPPFALDHTHPNVLTASWEYGGRKRVGEVSWALIQSDEHIDNISCDREMLRRHHKEAVERGALILKIGDTFCAMGGKFDKRSDLQKVRPEHRDQKRYLDLILDDAYEFFKPFAANIGLMGLGNHETGVRNHHGVDLIERLAGLLNTQAGGHIQAGGYTGWVRLKFQQINHRTSRNIWYTHGYGGGGPVTKDMIQAANRQPAYIRNANIMCSGHTHDQWYVPLPVQCLDRHGLPFRDEIHILKLGTYKDAYDTGMDGFEVERGHPPKPIGAWWVRFIHGYRTQDLRIEVTRAT